MPLKHFHSILKLHDDDTETYCVVVCETQTDEKDVIRNAENRRLRVTNLAEDEAECLGITLNDFDH